MKFLHLLPPKYILAFFFLVFVSCNETTSPDKTPPALDKISPDTLKSFDTLTVNFSEKIDTSTLEIAVIGAPIQSKIISQTQIKFFGKERKLSRSFFRPDTNYEVVLKNLQDLKGNTAASDQTIKFKTHTWIDGDWKDSTYDKEDTLSLDTLWKNGKPIKTNLYHEGAIWGDFSDTFGDRIDRKVLVLDNEDTLYYDFTCTTGGDLEFSLWGPFATETWQDSVVNMKGSSPNLKLRRVAETKCKTEPGNRVKGSYITKSSEYRENIKFGVSTGIYVLKIGRLGDSKGYYTLNTRIGRPPRN